VNRTKYCGYILRQESLLLVYWNTSQVLAKKNKNDIDMSKKLPLEKLNAAEILCTKL